MITERKSRFENGQSMVEFAVSAIVLLMILVAVLDLGRAFFVFIALRDAAQEGAFYASICPADVSGIQQRALQTSTLPVNLAVDEGVVFNCTYIINGATEAACSSATAATLKPATDTVKVEIEYTNFEITTPLLGGIIGTQTLTIRANATDHILRSPTSPPTKPCTGWQ